jgi:hypothetical protein
MQLLLDERPLSLYVLPIGRSAAKALALRGTPLGDAAAGHADRNEKRTSHVR